MLEEVNAQRGGQYLIIQKKNRTSAEFSYIIRIINILIIVKTRIIYTSNYTRINNLPRSTNTVQWNSEKRWGSMSVQEYVSSWSSAERRHWFIFGRPSVSVSAQYLLIASISKNVLYYSIGMLIIWGHPCRLCKIPTNVPCKKRVFSRRRNDIHRGCKGARCLKIMTWKKKRRRWSVSWLRNPIRTGFFVSKSTRIGFLFA